MNKDYAYYKRVTECAQDLFDNRLGWSEGRNPYAPKEIWLKLEKALFPSDTPDPQPSVPRDGGIVEAWDEWNGAVGTGRSNLIQHKARACFRLIASKIEAVRKEVEGNIRCFARIQGSALSQDLGTLERKIKVLEGWIKTIGIHSRQLACLDESELRRKVEELEERFRAHKILATIFDKPQPTEQPFALDEKGEKHPLIPGRSVISVSKTDMQILFHHRDDDDDWGYLIHNGFLGFNVTHHQIKETVWLRDLDFPEGDK